MWRRLAALVLMVTLPASATAGPLKEAAERAGRALGTTQPPSAPRGRGRVWTGIALIAGGAALTIVGAIEMREDDDATDAGDESAGEDSSGLEKAMLGGGLGAVAAGGVLLLTGRHQASPSVAVGRGRLVARHTIRF